MLLALAELVHEQVRFKGVSFRRYGDDLGVGGVELSYDVSGSNHYIVVKFLSDEISVTGVRHGHHRLTNVVQYCDLEVLNKVVMLVLGTGWWLGILKSSDRPDEPWKEFWNEHQPTYQIR